VAFVSARVLRNTIAAILAAASLVTIAPAFADKPATVLDAAKPVKITAIPIDFDRDNPERKDFGKLVRRGCLNLFTNSSYFGGFSELAIDASVKTILAISDVAFGYGRRSITTDAIRNAPEPRHIPLSSAVTASSATLVVRSSDHLRAHSPFHPVSSGCARTAASK
jgi:hypothetical protein